MTDTTRSSDPSTPTWQGMDHHVRVPDTSMLPDTQTSPPATVALMKRAVQGAHTTIDRLADSAAPRVRHIGEVVACVDDALQVQNQRMRNAGDEWTDDLRDTVRRRPLTSVVVAFALGAVLARIAR